MSLPPPQLWRLWTPPMGPVPSCSATCNVNTALSTLNARNGDANRTVRRHQQQQPARATGAAPSGRGSSNVGAGGGASDHPNTTTADVRLLVLHPVFPLVAYVSLPTSSTTTGLGSAIVVVQDVESGEVTWCATWTEIAACLYGEKNAGKLPAAVKSLGSIVSLEWMDPQTNFWNGVAGSHKNMPSQQQHPTPNSHFQWLVVQTTSRVLVLSPQAWSRHGGAVMVNHGKAARPAWFVSHLHEKSLGSVPSSNLLALDPPSTWLVGCADGTLKAWDKNTHAPTKSIKGLGKGDWIVRILAANRYGATSVAHAEPTPTNAASSAPSTSTSAIKKRILTVTRKNSVYLIELETHPQLEIKPPLARFVLPESLAVDDANSNDSSLGLGTDAGSNAGGGPNVMEHTIVSYDAQRNWLQWLVPASKKNPITTLLVWNLTALQPEFIKNQDSKSLFRPEPSLILQFPASSTVVDPSVSAASGSAAASANSTTVIPIVHAAFSEGTMVCAVANTAGELYVQAAVVPIASTKTIAATVLGIPLSQLLLQSLDLDATPVVTVTSMHAQAMGDRPILVLTTNYGLMCLEWTTSTGWSLPNGGVRHLHFGSGFGSLGKSVLHPSQSDLVYSSLDIVRPNPIGPLDATKNSIPLYESPPALHLPAEYQKRPFRMVPSLLPSPSGLYVAVMWTAEFRYEVLHLPSLLQKVTQRNHPNQVGATRNPVVATGTGVTSFAWVGDQDDFALLHAPHLMEEASMLLAAAPVLVVPTAEGGLTLSLPGGANLNVSNLMDIRAGALGVANAASSAVKGATSVTLNATKAAKDVTMNATKAAKDVTLTATKAATDATLKATKMTTKKVTKGMKKSFGIFGKKKKGGDGDGPSTITADDDDEDEDAADAASGPNLGGLPHPLPSVENVPHHPSPTKVRQYVELRNLVSLESPTSEHSATIAAATSDGLGELTIRGGNRAKPVVLFGGPVLIVGSRSDEDQHGQAHFYTRKQDEIDRKASVYVTTGPTLPFPDLIEWDEDGMLCAVATHNRIAVYLSDAPAFTLLGMLRVPNQAKIVSVRFVHGVIYCTTWNSLHCVFLGTLQGPGVCHMDMYTLASSVFLTNSQTSMANECASFIPPVLPLPLVQPVVLGYQSGSLLLSTSRGMYSVPLSHPLLRLGSLLAAGQVDRASKWLDAFPNRDHEALASFLERRGHADLASTLSGVSLETAVDSCIRFGYVDQLEELLEEYGLKGLQAIDMNRGVVSGMFGPDNGSHSLVTCVGAYLLAHGKVELTRRLATELLRSGDDGKRDAFLLACLLSSVDEADASRLIARSVEGDAESWLVGQFVRNYIIR